MWQLRALRPRRQLGACSKSLISWRNERATGTPRVLFVLGKEWPHTCRGDGGMACRIARRESQYSENDAWGHTGKETPPGRSASIAGSTWGNSASLSPDVLPLFVRHKSWAISTVSPISA